MWPINDGNVVAAGMTIVCERVRVVWPQIGLFQLRAHEGSVVWLFGEDVLGAGAGQCSCWVIGPAGAEIWNAKRRTFVDWPFELMQCCCRIYNIDYQMTIVKTTIFNTIQSHMFRFNLLVRFLKPSPKQYPRGYYVSPLLDFFFK